MRAGLGLVGCTVRLGKGLTSGCVGGCWLRADLSSCFSCGFGQPPSKTGAGDAANQVASPPANQATKQPTNQSSNRGSAPTGPI